MYTVDVYFGRAVWIGVGELARERVTVGVASVPRIDVPEAADTAAINEPLWDLVARVERTVIRDARDGEMVWAVRLRIPQHAVEPMIFVRLHIGAVIVSKLDSVEQIPGAYFW